MLHCPSNREEQRREGWSPLIRQSCQNQIQQPHCIESVVRTVHLVASAGLLSRRRPDLDPMPTPIAEWVTGVSCGELAGPLRMHGQIKLSRFGESWTPDPTPDRLNDTRATSNLRESKNQSEVAPFAPGFELRFMLRKDLSNKMKLSP